MSEDSSLNISEDLKDTNIIEDVAVFIVVRYKPKDGVWEEKRYVLSPMQFAVLQLEATLEKAIKTWSERK